MERDFLKDLELLGVTARLKRLSDDVSASIKELYRANGVDLEPSWHLVLLFLESRTASQSEIASSLRLSQPAMTKMIGRMVAKGYLQVERDGDDSRRKHVRLSPKARRRLPEFRRVWAAGQEAVRELLGADMAFVRHLDRLEARVGSRSFAERAQAHLDASPAEVTVRQRR